MASKPSTLIAHDLPDLAGLRVDLGPGRARSSVPGAERDTGGDSLVPSSEVGSPLPSLARKKKVLLAPIGLRLPVTLIEEMQKFLQNRGVSQQDFVRDCIELGLREAKIRRGL